MKVFNLFPPPVYQYEILYFDIILRIWDTILSCPHPVLFLYPKIIFFFNFPCLPSFLCPKGDNWVGFQEIRCPESSLECFRQQLAQEDMSNCREQAFVFLKILVMIHSSGLGVAPIWTINEIPKMPCDFYWASHMFWYNTNLEP